MLANIATPFGNAIVTAAIARYGDSAVAGYAVIGRIIPLAFGAIFALAGSIGPILGQNLGAERYDRVRRTLIDGMIFTTVYCVAMCVALLLLREPIVRVFGATGEGAELIRFFCIYVAPSWIVVGWLFVANAAFNNLGFPTWSTRVQLGPRDGRHGAVRVDRRDPIRRRGRHRRVRRRARVVFGIGAVIVCFMVVGRLADAPIARAARGDRLTAPPVPPFSSGKAATAIDSPAEEGRRQ